MKSFVTVETKQCPVCLEKHESGALLLDKRMKDSFEKETCTGWQLCNTHEQMMKDGYVAVIETTSKQQLKTASLDIPRSGRYAQIKSTAWVNIFNTPIPIGGIAFIDEEGFQILIKLNQGNTNEETNSSL